MRLWQWKMKVHVAPECLAVSRYVACNRHSHCVVLCLIRVLLEPSARGADLLRALAQCAQ